MLTKKQAVSIFVINYLPSVKAKHEPDGTIDIPARCEAWNDFTDKLQADGLITQKQCDTWNNPFKR